MRQEMWAVLYLHNWDESGQIYPEIHGAYRTWQEATDIVSKMSDPSLYFVRSVYID